MTVSSETAEVIYSSANTVLYREMREGTPVLLKTLAGEAPDAESRAMLAKEATFFELLHGLQVPTSLGLDESGVNPVLQLLDEGHLPLVHGDPWCVEQFISVALEVANAVVGIHSRSVIHCDLNPKNIVRRPQDGDIRIIDFGLAVSGSEPVCVESVVGTLGYLAPEQTGRIELPVDYRADLYALGATFYELLVGEPPFAAQDAVGLIHAHLSKPAPNVRDVRSEVPETISLIIAKLLSKQPDERYASACSLVADLENCKHQWETDNAITLFDLGCGGRPTIRTPSPIGVDEVIGELFTGVGERFVAVSGPSGSGKSMLLDLVRGVHQDNPTLLDGSWDSEQAASDTKPFGRLSLALTRYAENLLTVSDEELLIWRDNVVAAVGDKLGVLIDLCPTFGTLIGDLPEAPEDETAFGVNERVRAMEVLLADGGWEGAPVLFFDDVDTADSETVSVLAELIKSPKVPQLNVVCGAVELPDALAELIDDESIETCAVELGLLDLRSVTELVQEALADTTRPALELAELLMPVTGGNPGLVLTVLRQQAEAGALVPNGKGAWEWDDDRFTSIPRIESLVELLIGELNKLEEPHRRCIGIAGCFDDVVKASELAVGGIGVQEATEALAEGARLGFLRVEEAGYLFVDPRVKDAAQGLLDAETRSSVHLSLAREHYEVALADQNLNEAAEEIAGHLDLVAPELLGVDDRSMAVIVHRAAATLCQTQRAFVVAYRHLGQALSFCVGNQTETFEISLERAVCARAGGMEIAEAEAESLVEIAADSLQRAQAHECRAGTVLSLGLTRSGEALDIIRQGLAEVSISMPETEAAIATGTVERLTNLRRLLSKTSLEDLAVLPLVQEKRVEIAMTLMARAIPAAFRSQSDVVPWIELSMFELVVENGLSPEAPSSLLGASIVVNTMMGDAKTALVLAETASRVAERFPETHNASALAFRSAIYLKHLDSPIETTIAGLGEAWKIGANSDPQQAAQAAAHRCILGEIAGLPLDEQESRLKEAEEFIDSVGSLSAKELVFPYKQTLGVLTGQIGPETATQRLDERLNRDTDIPEILSAHIYLAAATIEWWVGRPTNAWAYIEAGAEASMSFAGTAKESHYLLYVVLAGVGTLNEIAEKADEEGATDAPDSAEIESQIVIAIGRLLTLADQNPVFHGVFARLAEAEWGRYRGEGLAHLVEGYDSAVTLAANRYPHLRAMSNRRHAELWEDRKQKKVAQALFVEAMSLYEAWQCKLACQRLEAAHPDHLRPGIEISSRLGQVSNSVTVSQDLRLEVQSVVKATRAIASEVTPEGLFSVLMKTLVEHAGAQNGALISIEDNALRVEASIGPDGEPNTTPSTLSAGSGVAVRAVNVVRRMNQLLVVANAEGDARFRNDGHVRANKVKSLACVPLNLRGELSALLYLENNALTNAFTAEHVEFLKVIAGQAAVSIQTARVFAELEDRVASRTQALAEKTRQVGALLDNLPQAVVTIGTDRIIQPEYSKQAPEVLETTEIAGSDVLETVFSGTSVTEDVLSRCGAALDFSFGSSTFMAELNWPHLVTSPHARRVSGPAELQR